MVFPLYALLLVVSSSGIPVAISKMVAKANTKDNTRAECKRILINAIVLLGIIGLIVSALLFGLAFPIAALQGNTAATKIYFAIAPAIFLVCLISAIRGYFQGLSNMIPTATSQIVEQVTKVGAGLALVLLLIPRGVEWAVFGAILAVTISEFAALTYLMILYFFHLKKQNKGKTAKLDLLSQSPTVPERPKQSKATQKQNGFGDKKVNKFRSYISRGLMWEIIKKSVPITLMAALFPLILVFDSLVVIHLLQSGGASNQVATQLYGISSGTVHTLINMPAVLGIAIGAAVVPMTASLLQKKNKDAVRDKTLLAVKISLILGLFFMLFYIAFSREIITLLYERAFEGNTEQLRIATNLLRIEAVMILLMGLTQVFTSLLQGAGRAKFPLIGLAIGGAVKVTFSLVFIRTGMGIYAVSIGNVLCFGIALALTAFFALRFLETKWRFNWKWWRLLALTLAYSAVLVILMLFLPSGKFWVLLAGATAASAYAAGLLLLFRGDKRYREKKT